MIPVQKKKTTHTRLKVAITAFCCLPLTLKKKERNELLNNELLKCLQEEVGELRQGKVSIPNFSAVFCEPGVTCFLELLWG